jgi:hypothetical protein
MTEWAEDDPNHLGIWGVAKNTGTSVVFEERDLRFCGESKDSDSA